MDITAFFLRHPAIQNLKYYNRFHESINDPRFGKRLEPGQVFLPNLTYSEGFALNFVAICCSDPNSESVFPPLDTVEINLDEEEEKLGSEDGLELQVAFVDALRSTSLTVKKLSLSPNFDVKEDRGLPLDVIIAIIQACPGLTHFECTFDAFDTHAPYEFGHQLFYNSILSHLPLLESLTVYYEYPQDSFDILSAEALGRERSIHCEAILNSLMYAHWQKHAPRNGQTINQDGFVRQDYKQGDRRGDMRNDMQDDKLRLDRVEVLARMMVDSYNLQEQRFCFVYEDGGIIELD
ncbi:hypothetical protein GGU11DRAFT_747766 [Lentinula aff. detonsa]|nr:hypothetical protein GGU11DRAFT_747766 [Lentinula aff. detonsa]